jgi:hypothetical protein
VYLVWPPNVRLEPMRRPRWSKSLPRCDREPTELRNWDEVKSAIRESVDAVNVARTINTKIFHFMVLLMGKKNRYVSQSVRADCVPRFSHRDLMLRIHGNVPADLLAVRTCVSLNCDSLFSQRRRHGLYGQRTDGQDDGRRTSDHWASY